jgi:peptidoglycan/xylan/chitin deacetylase (PgdA/CDA1 family)
MNSSFPVVFGIDLDAEAGWSRLLADGAPRPILMSQGAYAVHEGLEPLLNLLDHHSVVSTFFVPGQTVDRYPEAVRSIHQHGHEVASHGYDHLALVGLNQEQERDELVRGIEAITTVVGHRPVTWRAPGWELTDRSIDLLLEAGVGVSANFQDQSRPYRHVRNGEPIPLVELPVHWHLADAPYFLYGGGLGGTIDTPSTAYENWSEEFLALYDERPGSFFHLTLHVQLIGHPGRLRMVERLIKLIKSKPRAAFMRCDELAAEVA